MKKFLTSSYALSFAANVITSSAGFISIWSLARILSPEDLGQWLIFITAFSFGDMMRSGIIHTALIKYSSQKDKQSVIGASWVIGILLSLLLVAFIWLLGWISPVFMGRFLAPELWLYLKILIIASFPYTISLWLQQLEGHFKRIMYLRLLLTLPFLFFIISGFFTQFSLQTLIQIHLSGYILSSTLVIAFGWSSIRSMIQAKSSTIKRMLTFGRYSMGTLISTNLLKSTDTFMITWYLGPAMLAAYNLPYKLIELIEIPLRSLAATYLPQAAKQSNRDHLPALTNLFYQYAGLLTILLLPVSLGMFIFARELVVIVAGETYASSASIFRCFIIYSVFLPLDRFLGITLDILNKPHLNLLKVCLMVCLNITGNLAAIHFFASPFLMAVATVVTIAGGTILGWLILKKILPVTIKGLIYSGYFAIGQCINRQAKPSAV